LLEAGAAYPVPQDAVLVVRIHYERPQGQAAPALPDRSQVGLYLAPREIGRALRSLEIGAGVDGPWDAERTFSETVGKTIRVLALRPVSGRRGLTVTLGVVSPDGYRKRLRRIRLR
jgi:hypothetical protein